MSENKTSVTHHIIVLPIKNAEAKPWLINKHYAHRTCPISYAFGAYRDGELIGIVTYGIPVSSNLRKGICGHEWKDKVLELNRLCCENTKNTASLLVGRSLALLPKPSVVVSYADTKQGHIGYVYQATNFLYTGLSANRTDWALKGREHLHGATVSDMSRGHKNRAAFMREKYSDDFYLKHRSRKHRYVFFCGNKTEKRNMRQALRYELKEYPKGESRRYDVNTTVETQGILFWA